MATNRLRQERLSPEVLAEGLDLALVVGADALPVEQRGRLEHPLERQLADLLLVLDHERDVVGPHLQRRGRAMELAGRVEAETRVEEAGIVRAQLAAGRV